MGVKECIDCSKCNRTCWVKVSSDGELESMLCDRCKKGWLAYQLESASSDYAQLPSWLKRKETGKGGRMTDYGEPWEPVGHHFAVNCRKEAISKLFHESRDRDRAVACVNACAGIQDPEKSVPFILEVLDFIAKEDLHGMIFWRTDGKFGPVTFWINTNDLIAWGCADAEEINAETLPILKQAIEDCKQIDPVCGAITGCCLFACRVRKIRPQGAAYPEERDLWPLFDACGPEREVGLGNPYPPGGSRKGK